MSEKTPRFFDGGHFCLIEGCHRLTSENPTQTSLDSELSITQGTKDCRQLQGLPLAAGALYSQFEFSSLDVYLLQHCRLDLLFFFKSVEPFSNN